MIKKVFPKNSFQSFLSLMIIYISVFFILFIFEYLKIESTHKFIEGQFVSLISIIFFLGLINRENPLKNIFRSQKIKLRIIIYAIVGIILLQISIGSPLYFIISNYFNIKISQITFSNLDIFYSSLIIAPFLEEIIFRKVIFKNLLVTNSYYYALIVSSFLFAFAHPSINNFLPSFF